MDKKNTTIGIVFMAAAFGVMLYQLSSPRPVQPPVETPVATGTPVASTTSDIRVSSSISASSRSRKPASPSISKIVGMLTPSLASSS